MRLPIDRQRPVALYQQIDNYGVNRKVEWTARPDERLEGFSMAVKP